MDPTADFTAQHGFTAVEGPGRCAAINRGNLVSILYWFSCSLESALCTTHHCSTPSLLRVATRAWTRLFRVRNRPSRSARLSSCAKFVLTLRCVARRRRNDALLLRHVCDREGTRLHEHVVSRAAYHVRADVRLLPRTTRRYGRRYGRRAATISAAVPVHSGFQVLQRHVRQGDRG